MKYPNIVRVSYAGNPISNSAMFVTKKVEHLLENLSKVENCLVFCDEDVNVPKGIKELNHIFVFTNNPHYDYSLFANNLYHEIHKDDHLKKYTFENGYTIGENVILGNNVVIEPNCLIDHDCTIGNNVYIKSGAKIRRANISDDCVIHENAVIGADAFTIGKDKDKNSTKIPTFGQVYIGKNVEIGPMTSISASSTDKTIIDDYTKIDSHCYIAHDVNIGKNVTIASGATIGGFAIIQDYSYISMNTTVRNRVKLVKGTYLGMGAVLVKNVDEKNTLVGNPAKVLRKKD